MTPWQWIIAGALAEVAILLALCAWQVRLDIRQDRRMTAHLEARRAVADDQRNVDMTFRQLTDPAHWDKTGGPA